MIELTICLVFFLLGLSLGLMVKPDEVTKITYGVEIEDDGETAVVYFKTPEHKGELVTILTQDGDKLKIFKEEKEI